MRITTWNVNGIRNPFAYAPWNDTSRTFPDMFKLLQTDILILQELKIQRKDLEDDMVLIDGWDCYLSLPQHKKGYSGVAIYTCNAVCAPIRAEDGLLGVLSSPSGPAYRDLPEGECIGGYPTQLQIAHLGVGAAELDAEGRCVVLEFPAFVLLGLYSPANSDGTRDDFRLAFIQALDYRVRNLVKAGKNVVVAGDLNLSPRDMDSAHAQEDIRKGKNTREDFLSSPSRRIFNQLLMSGEVIGERDEGREEAVLWDTTREFHPELEGMYTCWNTKLNHRPANYGTRIDFVLVSELIQSWIHDASSHQALLGSDHCPVFADFKDEVPVQDRTVHLLDLMNPPSFFEGGKREQEWKLSSTPAFSAKRMPEFHKRRSIKSMFAASSVRHAHHTSTPEASGSTTGEAEPTPEASGSATGEAEPTPETSGSTTGKAEPSSVATPPRTESPPKPLKGRLRSASFLASNTTTPALKRRAPSSTNEQPSKKTKPAAKNDQGKGQQSLLGFIHANIQARNLLQAVEKSFTETESPDQIPFPPIQWTPVNMEDHVAKQRQSLASPPALGSTPALRSTPALGSTQVSARDSRSPSPSDIASLIASAEETQKSWGAIFTKPAAPMCRHDEPCKTMLTKKKGGNQGRHFWMCARPPGPTGEKEHGTKWQCATFIWASEWPKNDGRPANWRTEDGRRAGEVSMEEKPAG